MRRRDVLALAMAAAPASSRSVATADPIQWSVRVLRAARPLRRLHADGTLGLLALDDEGTLWRISPDQPASRLAGGLDPSSRLASGGGRIAGRGANGRLWVWQNGRSTEAPGLHLAPDAGLLALPEAMMVVDVDHSLVLVGKSKNGWAATAHSAEQTLPDARPILVDLDNRRGGGHVAVLAGANAERYRHGVLGDAIEATRVLWLDRDDLRILRSLDVPAPDVIEDIAPRPVLLPQGSAGLLTVRSGVAGGQLAVIAAEPARADLLRFAALGAPLGTRHRWMAPTTDGRRLLAVHTPHVAGTLHSYAWKGDALIGTALSRDISTHRIGTRELDLAVWLGHLLAVPSQDGRRMHVFDADAGWRRVAEAPLPSPVVQTATPMRGAAFAALLEDGRLALVRP